MSPVPETSEKLISYTLKKPSENNQQDNTRFTKIEFADSLGYTLIPLYPLYPPPGFLQCSLEGGVRIAVKTAETMSEKLVKKVVFSCAQGNHVDSQLQIPFGFSIPPVQLCTKCAFSLYTEQKKMNHFDILRKSKLCQDKNGKFSEALFALTKMKGESLNTTPSV